LDGMATTMINMWAQIEPRLRAIVEVLARDADPDALKWAGVLLDHREYGEALDVLAHAAVAMERRIDPQLLEEFLSLGAIMGADEYFPRDALRERTTPEAHS